MFSGKLDRRVIFQIKTTDKDSYGSETTSWADSFTTFAMVIEQKGKEIFGTDQDAVQKTSRANIILKIRFRTDINVTDYRFIHNSKHYDIFSIAELGRKDGLEVLGELLTVT